jgi:GDP-L-fucose synthase
MRFDFKNKNVLVAGGTGMVGTQLVQLLIGKGAKVTIASMDDKSRSHPKSRFIRADLTYFSKCLDVTKNMDYVFNLMGVKGSPAVTKTRPASFFTPMVMFSTALLEAARKNKVKGYLYTSSVGVYSPAEVFYEDSVWKTMPSENDWYPGWAKRIGELHAETYAIEYGWNNISIVRPANIYGPYDNFDSKNAMVIPSLIKRAVEASESGQPLVVWGDGTPQRDFIFSKDAARGMLLMAELGYNKPVNLGSGTKMTIKQLAEAIAGSLDPKPKIVWDKTKPKGDKKRILNTNRIKKLGFKTEVKLKDGIKETIDWYLKNRNKTSKRYDIFNK